MQCPITKGLKVKYLPNGDYTEYRFNKKTHKISGSAEAVMGYKPLSVGERRYLLRKLIMFTGKGIPMVVTTGSNRQRTPRFKVT